MDVGRNVSGQSTRRISYVPKMCYIVLRSRTVGRFSRENVNYYSSHGRTDTVPVPLKTVLGGVTMRAKDVLTSDANFCEPWKNVV